MTEEKVAPHFYVPRPRVEGNSTKNRGFAIAGETPANVEGTQSRGIPKTGDRLFFGTSYGVGCEAVNQPHILGNSTVECLRKLWER